MKSIFGKVVAMGFVAMLLLSTSVSAADGDFCNEKDQCFSSSAACEQSGGGTCSLQITIEKNPPQATESIDSGALNSGIVPCGTATTGMCTICHVLVLAKNVVQFILRIIAFVAVLMIVVAGVLYVVSAGNDQMMSWAKNLLKNVFIGVVMVLVAWIVVTTVINILAGRGDGSTNVRDTGPWYNPTLTCTQRS